MAGTLKMIVIRNNESVDKANFSLPSYIAMYVDYSALVGSASRRMI